MQASRPKTSLKIHFSTDNSCEFWSVFQKPHLQNTSEWLFLRIPSFHPRFYLFVTIFSCFPSFLSGNFNSALICRLTLEKLQISHGKGLGNCCVSRQTPKVDKWADYKIPLKLLYITVTLTSWLLFTLLFSWLITLNRNIFKWNNWLGK